MEPPGSEEIDRMPEKMSVDIKDVDESQLMDGFGNPVTFKDIRHGSLCIFVFVRHFLDYITKEYVEDFSKIFPRNLQEHNVKIVVVGCAPSRFIKPFCDETSFPHEMYCDSKCLIHRKLGLYDSSNYSYTGTNSPHIKSNAFLGFFNTVWRSIKSTVQQGDPFQQGGQLVINEDGKVLFFHRDNHSQDHTPLNQLLEVAGLERIDFQCKYKIQSI